MTSWPCRRSAIINQNGNQYVRVVDDPKKKTYHQVQVQTGLQADGGLVEITSGLERRAGDSDVYKTVIVINTKLSKCTKYEISIDNFRNFVTFSNFVTIFMNLIKVQNLKKDYINEDVVTPVLARC